MTRPSQVSLSATLANCPSLLCPATSYRQAEDYFLVKTLRRKKKQNKKATAVEKFFHVLVVVFLHIYFGDEQDTRLNEDFFTKTIYKLDLQMIRTPIP